MTTDEADVVPERVKVNYWLSTWVLVAVMPSVIAGSVYFAGRWSTMAMLYLTRLLDSYYATGVKRMGK